jgi:predicted nucleic acid-binding protein
VAEARAWLERTDPGDPAHAAAEAAFAEYAALLIRIKVRLAEYRRAHSDLREAS